jgi:RHS repeat-associated protein
VQQNIYDGLTRRVQQTVSGTTRNYFYSKQWQSLEERLGTSTTSDRQFVWGLRYIDDCVLRDRSNGGTLNERLFAMQDANWNVVAICNTVASILERYAYTAYGVVQFQSGIFVPLSGNISAYDWETLYCGYRYDSAVGLYLARYRWLFGLLGGWISRDWYRQGGQLTNRYSYVSSCPVSWTDPLGLVKHQRHHWLMRLGGKGQGDVDAICSSPTVNINDFTTEYTVEEHKWLHTWPKGAGRLHVNSRSE